MQIYIRLQNVKEQMHLILNQVEDALDENDKNPAELMDSLKEEYIIRAKAASYIIEDNSSYEGNINEYFKCTRSFQQFPDQ